MAGEEECPLLVSLDDLEDVLSALHQGESSEAEVKIEKLFYTLHGIELEALLDLTRHFCSYMMPELSVMSKSSRSLQGLIQV